MPTCSHVGEAHGDVLYNIDRLAPDSVYKRTDGCADEVSMEVSAIMMSEVVKRKNLGRK
jgi:hypothetical protein